AAGRLVLAMELRPELERRQGSGQWHGGPLAGLIDTAGDFAVALGLGAVVPTINFRVDYLRPAMTPRLTATATVRRAGRTVGVVALIFIGPKDLPRALRIAGYWVGRARTLSREFQSSVDQMIREAELDEMREQLKKATEFDIEKEFHKAVDPTGELAESIKPP